MIQTDRTQRTPVTVGAALFSHPTTDEPAAVAGDARVAAARQVRFTAPSPAPARRR